MKKLNSIVLKFSSSLAALALLVGVSSAASACYFWFNQPKMPKAIEKFRKTSKSKRQIVGIGSVDSEPMATETEEK